MMGAIPVFYDERNGRSPEKPLAPAIPWHLTSVTIPFALAPCTVELLRSIPPAAIEAMQHNTRWLYSSFLDVHTGRLAETLYVHVLLARHSARKHHSLQPCCRAS